MSLDVRLYSNTDEPCYACGGTGICRQEMFSYNITHNLIAMASEAGLYEALWRPDEIGITTARELIAPLREGLETLLAHPEKFKTLNPLNEWGNYDGLVGFVDAYLAACEQYPDTAIEVSR